MVFFRSVGVVQVVDDVARLVHRDARVGVLHVREHGLRSSCLTRSRNVGPPCGHGKNSTSRSSHTTASRTFRWRAPLELVQLDRRGRAGVFVRVAGFLDVPPAHLAQRVRARRARALNDGRRPARTTRRRRRARHERPGRGEHVGELAVRDAEFLRLGTAKRERVRGVRGVAACARGGGGDDGLGLGNRCGLLRFWFRLLLLRRLLRRLRLGSLHERASVDRAQRALQRSVVIFRSGGRRRDRAASGGTRAPWRRPGGGRARPSGRRARRT